MARNVGLLILRLSIGTMLIHHGYEKTADIQNFADAFVRPIGFPFPIISSYIAAYSEIYGSWLLIAGLFTRLASLSIVGANRSSNISRYCNCRIQHLPTRTFDTIHGRSILYPSTRWRRLCYRQITEEVWYQI